MAKLTKNFTAEEFECPCCKGCEIDIDFVKKLQKIRSKVGFGMKINSGWRCEKHNAEVSKRSMGDHVKGLACDVHCPDRYKRASILKEALNIGGLNDIAIGKTFIHLGVGKTTQGIGIYG